MGVTSLLAAFAAVLVLAALQRRLGARSGHAFLKTDHNAEYLFDGEVLIDASPAARSLLPMGGAQGTAPWPRLLAYLDPFFPDVSNRFATLQSDGQFVLSSAQGALVLRAEWRGGLTRVSLSDTEKGDSLTRHAIQEELDQLRDTVTQAPLPIWRERPDGAVVWCNAAYLGLVTRGLEDGDDLPWPLPRLFPQFSEPEQRQRLDSGPATLWYDLAGFDGPRGRLCFARPADKLVHAEDSLQTFMQTLTKTFAHLPTGLAIFDQARKLALFNPALVDLTGLAPDMLIGRPTLITFFDALRDKSMIPEPRNYRSWRDRITNLEEAAASGVYEDTWNLAGGQTYRVTGRPHPNGALALLFEDISTEMTQTRRYRADLELGQAVIDAMDDAVAVFSAAGVLVMSNTAYSRLWGHDPAATLGSEGNAIAVCTYWRDQSVPSAMWDRAEDFIATLGERTRWEDETRLSDGRRIACRFTSLAGGATLAAFHLPDGEAPTTLAFFSSRISA
jgi:PAS domain-containing protein